MKKTSFLLLAIPLALGLAACGGDNSPASQHVSISSPTPTQETTTSAKPEKNPYKACEIMLGDGSTSGVVTLSPDLIISIGDSMTNDQITQMLDMNSEIQAASELSPSHLKVSIDSFGLPFAHFASHMEGGGGEISMDTSRLPEYGMEIVDICADEGYALFPEEEIPSISNSEGSMADLAQQACDLFDEYGVEGAMFLLYTDDTEVMLGDSGKGALMLIQASVDQRCPEYSDEVASYLK